MIFRFIKKDYSKFVYNMKNGGKRIGRKYQEIKRYNRENVI